MNDDASPGGRGDSTAGAWAAAAIVLALGALAFGVWAQLRVNDLESELDTARALDVLAEDAGTVSSDAASGDGGAVAEDTTTTTVDVPPTSTQPADPDDARAEITEAFETVYDGGLPIVERLALLDDTSGVERAMRGAANGEFGDSLLTLTATVEDVTFASSARALVVYSTSALGIDPQPARRGEARISGGQWKVTRATVCSDLSALGSSCG